MFAHELARKQTIAGPLAPMRSMLYSRLLLSGILALGSIIVLPMSALSQSASATTAPATQLTHHKKPVAAAPAPEPAPPPQPTVAPSLFEQPAAPATVTAHTNELTVTA